MLNPTFEYTDTMRGRWWMFVTLGILLVLAGIVAIVLPLAAARLTTITVGIVLIAGGIFQIVKAFGLRGAEGFWLLLLTGILAIVVGAMILGRPTGATVLLAWLVAVYFLAVGFFRLIAGIAGIGLPYSGFAILGGILDLILGAIMLSGWQLTAVWVIGIFVGIDLIYAGIWAMTTGFGMHSAMGAAHPRPA